MQHKLAFNDETWIEISDGEPGAAAMYERHYSSEKSRALRRARGTMLFVGPGQKMVLVTPCRLGLFVWRKFISDNDQDGINCAVFRNEGAGRSSDMIRAADAMADRRWPGERHYTYVNAAKTKDRRGKSSLPGHCFIMAGYQPCGVTKHRKLVILERMGNTNA